MSNLIDSLFNLKDDPWIRQIEAFGTTDTRPVRNHCECCGEDLYDGDTYYDLGGAYCAECIENMSAEELLDMLSLTRKELLDMCGYGAKTL